MVEEAEPGARPKAVGAAKAALGEQPGFEARRQKQLVRAALFGKPPPPARLHRYLVLRELGAGGMGVVYLAYDDQLDRRVAVKLLRGSTSSDKAKARLQREAQAMARLSHPNVVAVYEVGEFEGEVFVAMEFVAGRDLGAWLDLESRSWREVLAVYLDAGAGLAAAHEAGLVHRDFKPDNILVGDDGRVRVADFGLASATGAAPVDPDASTSASTSASASVDPDVVSPAHRSGADLLNTPLTRTGALLGTPAYMAPEQFLGAPTDARSDQFSFCVALWEGLYGERPFTGTSVAEIARAVLGARVREPEPEAARKVPPWIRAALERGLAREPEARWPGIAELLAALADDPELRRRRRLRALGLGLSSLALVASLTGWAAHELRANIRQRYWNALTEELLQIERERGLDQANDDARRARDATKLSVYRSYQAEPGAVDHEDPALAAMLLREVSPSSRASETWISAANLTLGRPLSQAVFAGHTDTVTALGFAPNHSALYSAAADGEVWRWALDSGLGQRLYRHTGAVTALLCSPDGDRVLSSSADHSVRSWRQRDQTTQLLTEHADPVTALALSPDGQVLASASKSGELQLTTLASGVSRQLAGPGPGSGTAAIHALDFEPSGARLVSAGNEREVRVWSLASGQVEATGRGHTQPIYHARFVGPGPAGAGRVVTAADDGVARAWASVPGEAELAALGSITEHGAAISALAIHSTIHGTSVATAAVDGSVKVGSLDRLGELAEPAEPAEVTSLLAHPGQVWGLRFDPSGEHLITTCFDGIARVLRVDGRGPVIELRGHREALLPLDLDASGRWLATGSYDAELRIWDLARPALDRPLLGHRAGLHDVELAPGGARALTASADGSVRVWATDAGVELARLERTGAWNVAVFGSRADPDDPREWVAAGANNGDITVWQPDTGERHDSPQHTDAIRDLRFTADGAALLSASSDHSARIWTPELDHSVELRGHEGIVTRILDDPAHARVATTSFDGSLRIWTLDSGASVAVLDGHQGPIRGLARNAAGVWATASDDHDARVWPDLEASHAIVLRGHEMRVQTVAFDAAGRRVVTASADGSARIWDREDGSLLETLAGHTGTVWGAVFVDDDHVLTHADDNTARLWSLAAGESRSIVLSGHTGAVIDLALDRASGGLALTASVDGSARIWHLDQLSDDTQTLEARLWEANISCIDPTRRVRDLGEDEDEAAASHQACERALGRD